MITQTRPRPGKKLRMSYEAFLDWAGEDLHAEWVEGEAVVHMTAKERHQEIVGFLFSLLGLFNQFFHLGRVFIAPFQVKLNPTGPGREPDILFVVREREHLIGERGVQGPADLVVEVVSDDSVTRDRVEKLAEYERYGVGEYWLIDPRPGREAAAFYQLDAAGRYQEMPLVEGVYHSRVLAGFWLHVAWLWQDPLPESFFAFAEIAQVPDEVVAALRKLQRP